VGEPTLYGIVATVSDLKRARLTAPERILRATAHRIVESGAVALTMQEVAEEAEVSKGLIHYHFHDKDTLLARLVEWMTRHLVQREQDALAHATPRSALDDVWGWIAGEMERGHIRVLLELAEWRSDLVRRASRNAARGRREAAGHTVERLFTLLELRPRVPPPLVADVVVAFIDGIAMSASLDSERNSRPAFDVFWLSLLSLAE
jgi:AcrR family transcriptional regulator